MIDAIDQAQRQYPWNDHRHTLQHCQMANTAQYKQMQALGICVNLFANHLYYWGDQHANITLGKNRAERMNACRTALDYGVPLAIHSDVPVTPLAPLFTAWCAVNRLTESGKILGENQRINIQQALHAITIGAAYTIRMDHLIGSIEIGKYADFAVLEANPLDTPAEELKDISVWGTIIAGKAVKSLRN